LCALQGRRVDLVVSGTMTDFPATLELDPLFLQVEPPTLYLLQLQTAATARGEVAARRAVYRCDRLVEMHRLVPPNRRWGPRLARCTCRIDFFRNSTDDCLSCQPNHRPRGFSRFSRLPWSKIDLPCTKFHLPWSKINLPYTRYIFFSPSLTRLPCTGLTYPVPKLTYPIPEISFSPSQTQLP
jgi:hypothetical protein